MATIVIVGGLLVLGLSALLCLLRAVLGPSPFDRMLAFDCLVLNVVGSLLLVSLYLGSALLLDLVLVLALLGFLSTISIAAYLEGCLGS